MSHQDFQVSIFLLGIENVFVLSILHMKHTNKCYPQLKDMKFIFKRF